MHYKYQDVIVKSENSAKPISTPSKDMLSLFDDFIQNSDTVLDFGCGKLRYTIPLSKIAKRVIGVDSKEQLIRTINISGETTTLVEYAKQFKNVKLYTSDSPDWKNLKYDKVVLLHVLSSIPFEEERIIVVKTLRDVMVEDSILLACTNHRMSYFKKWDQSDKIIKYNDGYLVKEPNTSYFGKIDKVKLAGYFESNGFEILKLFVIGKNSYCICKRNG
jgi:2-polyprenyl-3-methyl-5-hydroxy-6-metoxy-1,4-benzoquinol methylase